MLAAGGLQHLLQHLHRLLLPSISPAPVPAPADALPPLLGSAQALSESSDQAVASSSDTDSKGKLAVAPEDLDTLLAILEALACADAAAGSSANAQVTACRVLISVLTSIVTRRYMAWYSSVHL